jgi:hypothetical protein
MGIVAALNDLLFGLLALQISLIDQAKLVAAFHAWPLNRNWPLAERLDSVPRNLPQSYSP